MWSLWRPYVVESILWVIVSLNRLDILVIPVQDLEKSHNVANYTIILLTETTRQRKQYLTRQRESHKI